MPSTDRIVTRSKNAAQHPGLLVSKKQRRTKDQVEAARQAKEDVKTKKELAKAAGIKRVADFERKQAEDDSVEVTPRVAAKPKALVRTRSYADVLAGEEVIPSSDVDMADGETGSAFEPREEDEEKTTDNNAESTVIMSPPRKKKRVEVKQAQKAPKPKVRDAIKAVHSKKPENKQVTMSEEDDVVDVDPTPKPRKTYPKARVPSPMSEPADDLPPAARKASKQDLPALSDDDENDIPPPKKMGSKMGAKGDKGKGKATDPGKGIGTDQNHDRKNVPTKPKNDSKKKYADFSAGINNWAATIPKNSKPASKVASAAGNRSIAAASIYSGPPLTDATTRSSGTSALSKNIKVSRDIPVKIESHDTFIQVAEGGLEDDDETADLEREAAIKSPLKGKKRVSSSALVKESPSKVARAPERAKKPSNNDLPPSIDQKLWRPVFISTYMQWAATQPNPWDIPVKLACEKMQLIWNAIFPSSDYIVTSTSAVYLLAIQRAADSWRNAIGSAGLSVGIAYFESQDDLRDSDENRIEFAKYALDELRFCYKKARGDDPDEFQGLYQGGLIIQTFSAHFSAIQGAREILGVHGPDLEVAKPRGALALSIVAVERALTLFATGTITIKMIRTAKGKTISLPKTLNYSTGKVSNRQTGFNDATWGKSTRSYVNGINENLADNMFELIIRRAKGFAKTSRHTQDKSDQTANVDAVRSGPDKRAQLKDRPCTDSEDGQSDSEDEEESE